MPVEEPVVPGVERPENKAAEAMMLLFWPISAILFGKPLSNDLGVELLKYSLIKAFFHTDNDTYVVFRAERDGNLCQDLRDIVRQEVVYLLLVLCDNIHAPAVQVT